MSPRAKVKPGGIIRKSIDLSWETPEFVLERVRRLFPNGKIPFDPATAPDNPTKAERFCAGPPGTLFGRESLASKNGLEVSWDWPFWVNPPFARAWIEKIAAEGVKQLGAALLPCNRFETPYMQRALANAKAVCFVDAAPFQQGFAHPSRIAFISSIDKVPVDKNPFASMILSYGFMADDFALALNPKGEPTLGTVFALRKAW